MKGRWELFVLFLQLFNLKLFQNRKLKKFLSIRSSCHTWRTQCPVGYTQSCASPLLSGFLKTKTWPVSPPRPFFVLSIQTPVPLWFTELLEILPILKHLHKSNHHTVNDLPLCDPHAFGPHDLLPGITGHLSLNCRLHKTPMWRVSCTLPHLPGTYIICFQ